MNWKSCEMYGQFDRSDNNYFYPGRYFPQTKSPDNFYQNIDPIYARECDHFCQDPKYIKNFDHEYNEHIVREKSSRRKHKDKKENKYFENGDTTSKQREEKKRRRKHRREKRYEYFHNNKQTSINDFQIDHNIPSKMTREEFIDLKKYQRSLSIDRIPTKDVNFDKKPQKRSNRYSSMERRQQVDVEKNGEFFMSKILKNVPMNNSIPVYNDQIETQLKSNQVLHRSSSKKRKDKTKYKKISMKETNMSEFVTLNQMNNQTMSIKDEQFSHGEHNMREFKSKSGYHHHPKFHEGCQHQVDKNYPFFQNVDEDERCKRFVQNNYEIPVNIDMDMNIVRKKNRRKDKTRELRRKDYDREHKSTQKSMKKLVPEETYFFTREDNQDLFLQDLKDLQNKLKTNTWEIMNLELETSKNNAKEEIGVNVLKDNGAKQLKKLEESSEIKHRSHKHKKHKHRSDKTKGDFVDRKRPASLNFKNKHEHINKDLTTNDLDGNFKGLLKRCKSEISFDCLKDDKDIICIYKSKESFDDDDDEDPVKITTKQNSPTFGNKYKKKFLDTRDECSPYFRNITVLHNGPMRHEFDVLDIEDSKSFSSKAKRKDFLVKPRKRITRSKQRSWKRLEDDAEYINGIIDKELTKETHSHDVGTSTILDVENEKIPERETIVNNEEVYGDETNKSEINRSNERMKNFETLRLTDKFQSYDLTVDRLGCEILSEAIHRPQMKDTKCNRHPEIKSHSILHTHERGGKISSSADKTIEHLMKYYKIDSQSLMNDFSANPQKTMKQILADKLTDCLRKLLLEENDESRTMNQTVETNIVKLVLPEDFVGHEQNENIKECYSDLFRNYSVENNAEKIISREASEVLLDVKYKCVGKSIETPRSNRGCFKNSDEITQNSPRNHLYYFETDNWSDFGNEKITDISRNSRIVEKQNSEHICDRFPCQLRKFDADENRACQKGMENNFCKPIYKSESTYSSDRLGKADRDESRNAHLDTNKNFEHTRNEKPKMTEVSCKEHQEEHRSPVDISASKSPREMWTLNLEKSDKIYSNMNRKFNAPQEIPAEMLSQKINASPRQLYEVNPGNANQNKIEDFENNNNYNSQLSTYGSQHLSIHGAVELSDFHNSQLIGNGSEASQTKRRDYEKQKPLSNRDEAMQPSHDYFAKKNNRNPFNSVDKPKCYVPQKMNRETTPAKGGGDTFFEDPFPENTQSSDRKSTRLSPVKMNQKTGNFRGSVRIDENNNLNSQHIPTFHHGLAPKKGYEYFEISPPRSKPNEQICRNDEASATKTITYNPKNSGQTLGKTSQIPKRIVRKTNDCERKNTQPMTKQSYEHFISTSCNARENDLELNQRLEENPKWIMKDSDTLVTNESINEKAKTNNIKLFNKDRENRKNNQEKHQPDDKDKMPSMLLTKTFRPNGQSSYEKRKMYDSMLRRNVKKRSQSLNSEQPKLTPVVFEVRYFNVQNNSPFNSFLKGSKSEQSLSADIVSNNFEVSEKTKTTSSSDTKENECEYDLELSTEPSCLLKDFKKEEKKDEPQMLKENNSVQFSTSSLKMSNSDKDFRVKNNNDNCLFTEPSCLLKESKYNVKTERKKLDSKDKETCSNNSSRSTRIQELIKDNLLYANYPSSYKKTKPLNQRRKRRKKTEKITDVKRGVNVKPKSKTKHCEKRCGDNERCLKIVARLSECKDDGYNEDSKMADDHSLECHDVPELTIDKINENEIRVTFGDNKLDSVEKLSSNLQINKRLTNGTESIVDSESSRTTLTNCTNCQSAFSEESQETLKGAKFVITSAEDSGYISKGAGLNNSETTLTSNNRESYVEETLTEGGSNWNSKDLAKLRIHLLFPYVYDDFELLETAQNTDLIKFYIDSDNKKLDQAIHSISQKGKMSTRSRSLMSLPSSKVITDEPLQKQMIPEGGFYNHQKFIALNNACYSGGVSSKLSNYSGVGDFSNIHMSESKNLAETASVKSCSVSSVKSGVTLKKSVIELFKLKTQKGYRSSTCVLSDSDTIVGVGEHDLVDTKMPGEDFFRNFQQIMEMECQKYAQKVRNRAESKETEDEDVEFEEISLDSLLKNKQFRSGGREFNLEGSVLSKDESNESFKSSIDGREDFQPVSKSEDQPKPKIPPDSSINLDFYPEERISVLDMVPSVQATKVSVDSRFLSSRNEDLDDVSSGISRYSEKTFFDALLAFYDKESVLMKNLMEDDGFFIALIELIESCAQKDERKVKKEKKRGILGRFFRRKGKKSTETLLESSEYTKSVNSELTVITRDSCYSFLKDLDDADKDTNEMRQVDSEHLKHLACKAKRHLEPMVIASFSNSHISDRIKLAGFLKMLDMVAEGDFTFLNNGDAKSLEAKLKEHVGQIFGRAYRIAHSEVKQKENPLDDEKIQLLKILVAKYHLGTEGHINILSSYIGRGLIETKEQLEDAIIFLMSQDSKDVSLEQFERNCGIHRNT